MLQDHPVYRFGSTTIAKVTSSSELRQALTNAEFDNETVIIKPNWMSTDPGDFTDAESLRMMFEAFTARFIVVESYSLARSLNLQKRGKSFAVGEQSVDWKWLLKGAGWNWLIHNPDWDWFKNEGHWDQLREEDGAFLEKYGFADLFKEFDVTYINVTEEVWSGRTADPTAIKQAVESRFRPVQCENLYSMVPQKLYDLRGSPFISFGRLKMYASFTFKNLFGMIPDPLRAWWHGPKNDRVTANIVDINKIYYSLFSMYGICEALHTMARTNPDGKYKGIFSPRYDITEGGGIIAFGRDLLSLDAMLLSLSDPSLRSIVDDVNRDPIALAEEEFGAIDRQAIDDALLKVKGWI
jgi:uncharacterized protein (DUF362 family)